METGKKAIASEKETASNIAAAAKAGMEKTQATLVEKGEKMAARYPLEKQLAEGKKEERKSQAEVQKQETRGASRSREGRNTCASHWRSNVRTAPRASDKPWYHRHHHCWSPSVEQREAAVRVRS